MSPRSQRSCDDDFDQARATLGELLRLDPRDALALQVAHSLDYVSGDMECMKERVAAVLPAWSRNCPATTPSSPCTPSASRRAAATTKPRRARAPRSRSTPSTHVRIT